MTTTTINDIADLARILREQPEWADTIRGFCNILLGGLLIAPRALPVDIPISAAG